MLIFWRMKMRFVLIVLYNIKKKMIKKLVKCRYWVLLLLVTLIFVGLNYVFPLSNNVLLILNPVMLSVFASFLVGVYFQYKLKSEISSEHLKIMEFKSEYNSSGIIKYYSSFKQCEHDLRMDLLKTQNVTIYLAYGATVINSLSEQINFILSDKKKKLNISFLSETNPFLDGLAAHWNYTAEELKSKINSSKKIVEDLAAENKNENLNIYENNMHPINYSFYLLDDIVYFVPTKLCNPKSFTPFTIKAQRTIDNGALYGKVKEDWEKLLVDLNANKKTL